LAISELLSQYGSNYIEALFTTWKLTAVSYISALVLGIIITIMRIAPIRPMRLVGNLYVQIFRNIPGAALLIWLAYALPYLDIILSYYDCVLITCALIPAAFCSEYLMSGINMINVGQFEAARALGMTFFQMVTKIIIPQAVRSSILPLTNLLVATMLTTALASLVPLNPRDLTGIVSYINTRAVGGVTAFFISAFFYLATALVIGRLGNFVAKKAAIMR